MRSEVDVVCDVLVQVMRSSKLLAVESRVGLLLLLEALGVNEADLARANARYDDHGYPRPLRSWEAPQTAGQNPSPPRPGRRSPRPSDTTNGGHSYNTDKKFCPGCRQRLPLDEFSVKDKKKGTLAFRCKPCLRDYQAARYLNTQRLDALDALGITFVLDAGDDVDGLVCAGCGERLHVGDQVAGDARLFHAERCHPAAVEAAAALSAEEREKGQAAAESIVQAALRSAS